MVAEEIVLEGHIIDLPVLTHVLDDICAFGGNFRILEIHIGRSRNERSHARIEVSAKSLDELTSLLTHLSKHGVIVRAHAEVQITEADMDGAFPVDFYSTTNQQTFLRWRGEWAEVQDLEMDCGVLYEPAANTFRCLPVSKVRKGDRVVCGHRGIKIVPLTRERESGGFQFMGSAISTEKPKTAIIRNCARQMLDCRQKGKKSLLVGGPAIVHTGSSEHVVKLIERGYFNVLFAGNALAAHDIEHNLYGTSLGIYVAEGTPADAGHEHHLRAINLMRREGGIANAATKGVLTGGIMHACVKHNVEFILAGSIRDDGPLPDVITDVLAAQDKMRAAVKDVGFVLMVATGLHSIATGNLLPAWIPVVCVDISPSILTKLADRGSFQTTGLVTDVEPFFRELLHEIELLEAGGTAELA